jgi:hypothetical protein
LGRSEHGFLNLKFGFKLILLTKETGKYTTTKPFHFIAENWQVHLTFSRQRRHLFLFVYAMNTAVLGIYTGDTQNGRYHGKGRIAYGENHYEGTFMDGKMHGEGRMTVKGMSNPSC